MGSRKHLGRGLADVSHVFLSRRQSSPEGAPAPAAAPGAVVPHLFVASGSEVIGKSVVACNVALELARRGRRTAVVDADPSLPTVRLLMGTVLGPGAGPARLAVDGGRTLSLFDTLPEAMEADEAWDYVVVNTPNRVFVGSGPPVGAARLLLVVSPEARALIRAYAVAKRAAGWHTGLRLGVVVSGGGDEASARAFFGQFLEVLERQIAVRPAYCGFLPGHDEVGRSVLSRVPAVLASEESELGERLRAIAAAVARVFEPAGSARRQ